MAIENWWGLASTEVERSTLARLARRGYSVAAGGKRNTLDKWKRSVANRWTRDGACLPSVRKCGSRSFGARSRYPL